MYRVDVLEALALDHQIVLSLSQGLLRQLSSNKQLIGQLAIFGLLTASAFTGNRTQGMCMQNLKLSNISLTSKLFWSVAVIIFQLDASHPSITPNLCRAVHVMKLSLFLLFISKRLKLPFDVNDRKLKRTVLTEYLQRAFIVSQASSMALALAPSVNWSYLLNDKPNADHCAFCNNPSPIRPQQLPCNHECCYVCIFGKTSCSICSKAIA